MRLLFLAVLLAGPAFADILPDEVGVCRGKAKGAACTTPEGQPGTCTEISVSRPDYSSGIPPKYTQVKMLGCVAVAKGSSKVAMPWVGLGLAFLATLAALGASASLGRNGARANRSARAKSRAEPEQLGAPGPSTALGVNGE